MSPITIILIRSSTHTSKNYYQMTPPGLLSHGQSRAGTKVCVLGYRGYYSRKASFYSELRLGPSPSCRSLLQSAHPWFERLQTADFRQPQKKLNPALITYS